MVTSHMHTPLRYLNSYFLRENKQTMPVQENKTYLWSRTNSVFAVKGGEMSTGFLSDNMVQTDVKIILKVIINNEGCCTVRNRSPRIMDMCVAERATEII